MRRSIEGQETVFENIRSDLDAYDGEWSKQGFWVMIVYRFGRWRYGVGPTPLRKSLSLVYKIMFKVVQIATGIELPCEATVGRHLHIENMGGIVITGYARIGDNCQIGSGVVIGLKHTGEPTAPTIGNNVEIGAGAVLLGDINIGDCAVIGANSVVLTDIPPNTVAMGVPATFIPRHR